MSLVEPQFIASRSMYVFTKKTVFCESLCKAKRWQLFSAPIFVLFSFCFLMSFFLVGNLGWACCHPLIVILFFSFIISLHKSSSLKYAPIFLFFHSSKTISTKIFVFFSFVFFFRGSLKLKLNQEN